MSVLDDLESEVGTNTTVTGSVTTLIANITAQCSAAGSDTTRLAGVLATLEANDERLAALVAQNTPAPQVPVPPPTPVNPAPASTQAGSGGGSGQAAE